MRHLFRLCLLRWGAQFGICNEQHILRPYLRNWGRRVDENDGLWRGGDLLSFMRGFFQLHLLRGRNHKRKRCDERNLLRSTIFVWDRRVDFYNGVCWRPDVHNVLRRFVRLHLLRGRE